jgi:hypothetical protein
MFCLLRQKFQYRNTSFRLNYTSVVPRREARLIKTPRRPFHVVEHDDLDLKYRPKLTLRTLMSLLFPAP